MSFFSSISSGLGGLFGGGGAGGAQSAATGAGIGAALGGPAGAGIGFAMGLANWGLGEVSAQRAYDRQKNWALRAPGYHADALERAGLNRALAATGGAASPSSAPSVPKGTGAPNISPKSLGVLAQLDNIQADTALKVSTADRVRTESEGVYLTNIEKRVVAQVLQSAEGETLMRNILEQRGNPSTWEAALIKLLNRAGNHIEATEGAESADPTKIKESVASRIRSLMGLAPHKGAAKSHARPGPRSVDPELERRQSIDRNQSTER